LCGAIGASFLFYFLFYLLKFITYMLLLSSLLTRLTPLAPRTSEVLKK
jgi:hypothetical protein